MGVIWEAANALRLRWCSERNRYLSRRGMVAAVHDHTRQYQLLRLLITIVLARLWKLAIVLRELTTFKCNVPRMGQQVQDGWQFRQVVTAMAWS